MLAWAVAATTTGAAMPAFLLRPSTAKFPNRRHRFSPRSSLRCCSFPNVNVVDILRERGLVESITSDNLRMVCSNPNIIPPLKVYCGFDPTAKSLHLGNLIGLIVLAWFQRCGHNAVALIGGATGGIGDPSGKSTARPELDVQTIENNSAEIRALLHRILHRAGCQKDQFLNSDSSFLVLDNFDWLKELMVEDFFRNVVAHVSDETLIGNESVKKRLMIDGKINFAQFSYQLLQGYDFLYMFKNMGVNVQIGGSDQWGNIITGIELIQNVLQLKDVYGLTFPLLLKSDGSKFGKSERGAIWLSPDMLSPYNFYRYLLSVPDDDVVRFLKIFTFLNLEEIQKIEEDLKKPDYVLNSAQKRLAEEVTHFVHGEEGLAEALKGDRSIKVRGRRKVRPKDH